MTDPLEKLEATLTAATPLPDRETKAAHLRRAAEIFDTLQGSGDAARPTSDRPAFGAGLMNGVRTMLNAVTPRGGLAATTALVALGLVLVIPQGRDLMTPPEVLPVPREEATLLSSPPVLERDMQLADTDDAMAPLHAPERERQPAPRLAAKRDMGQASAGKASPGTSSEISGYAPITRNTARDQDVALRPPQPDTEAFSNAPLNPVNVTVENPVSTFSIDVDTASYAVVRSSIMNGFLPPPAAVRIEEMINYFPYNYPAPERDAAPFRPTVTVLPTPWNANTRLVHIGIQGEALSDEARAPLNLVFLIDTSGSMQDANKLPLLKQSFRLMLSQLQPEDEVSIVTYAGSAGQVLAATKAKDRASILTALDRLEAGGSTAGQAGLQQAYSVAEAMAADGEITRVILATDGDFNVGLSDPEALKSFIAAKRETGTYLSVLGFGRGNLDDATMQALAQNGNGQAAYIDTLSEAQKVLVDQLTGALYPIAGDVKVQVEFNPAVIAEYRLIGYETRALRREDFNNDAVDAGDIGAGHSVTALYEVTPVGSPAILNDSLRYDTTAATASASDELGYLKLRYKKPGTATSRLIEVPIGQDSSNPSQDALFATAIAGFGQLLSGGSYLGTWGFEDAIAAANSAKGADVFGYRAEAVQLMRLAKTLAGN